MFHFLLILSYKRVLLRVWYTLLPKTSPLSKPQKVNLDSADESSHLALPDVVESDNPDSVAWVLVLALLDLLEDLISGLASEHRELPHGPVSVLVESRSGEEQLVGVGLLLGSELDAWSPAVADQVVDLPGDLRVGQRWQVGQALVCLLRLEDLHAGHHDRPSGGLGSDLPGLGWPGNEGLSAGHNHGVHDALFLVVDFGFSRTRATTSFVFIPC